MLTGTFLRFAARRSPHHTAVIGETARLSYAQLDAAANRLAHALLGLGADRHTRVAILSANRPEYAVAYFGAARAGCLLAHLSVRSTPDDLVFMLNKIGARILLFESHAWALVSAGARPGGGAAAAGGAGFDAARHRHAGRRRPRRAHPRHARSPTRGADSGHRSAGHHLYRRHHRCAQGGAGDPSGRERPARMRRRWSSASAIPMSSR